MEQRELLGSKKVYDAEAERLVKLLDKNGELIKNLQKEIDDEKELIEKEIFKIKDMTLQNVLISKYMTGEFYKSNYEVGEDLNCSESYIDKKLMIALREFEKGEKI